MAKKNYSMKNRAKNRDLTGLFAVPYGIAYKNGCPRKGVVACVQKGIPYAYKPQKVNSDKSPVFFHDITGDTIPVSLKNRMLSFYSDKENKKKSICYLVERPLFDELLREKAKKKKG